MTDNNISKNYDGSFNGITFGDLLEAIDSGEEIIDFGNGFKAPCSIAIKIKENIENISVSELIAANGTENLHELLQKGGKFTSVVNMVCEDDFSNVYYPEIEEQELSDNNPTPTVTPAQKEQEDVDMVRY